MGQGSSGGRIEGDGGLGGTEGGGSWRWGRVRRGRRRQTCICLFLLLILLVLGGVLLPMDGGVRLGNDGGVGSGIVVMQEWVGEGCSGMQLMGGGHRRFHSAVIPIYPRLALSLLLHRGYVDYTVDLLLLYPRGVVLQLGGLSLPLPSLLHERVGILHHLTQTLFLFFKLL